ncbi:MAG: hypothetical protein M3P26_07030 [Gemmatimonadota bacterium]|nr:hypothetical protein [Gemmatimonadota bacterium]
MAVARPSLYYPFFWINFAMTVALNNAAKQSAVAQLPATHTRRFPYSHRVTMPSLPPTRK